MSTLVIILIVLAVIALVAFLVVGRKAKERKDETRRVEAGQHRDEAQVGSARAAGREAEAEERGARAKREQAKAEEQSTLARTERQQAEDRHQHADSLDPDVDEDDERARRQEGTGERR